MWIVCRGMDIWDRKEARLLQVDNVWATGREVRDCEKKAGICAGCLVHEVWQAWSVGSDTEKFVYPTAELRRRKGVRATWNQTLSDGGKAAHSWQKRLLLTPEHSSEVCCLGSDLLSRLRSHKLSRQRIKKCRKSQKPGRVWRTLAGLYSQVQWDCN